MIVYDARRHALKLTDSERRRGGGRPAALPVTLLWKSHWLPFRTTERQPATCQTAECDILHQGPPVREYILMPSVDFPVRGHAIEWHDVFLTLGITWCRLVWHELGIPREVMFQNLNLVAAAVQPLLQQEHARHVSKVSQMPMPICAG